MAEKIVFILQTFGTKLLLRSYLLLLGITCGGSREEEVMNISEYGSQISTQGRKSKEVRKYLELDIGKVC